MIADEVNMNRGTVRLIVTEELGMRKICAKMVPRNLTALKRDARLSAVFTSKCITVMLQPPYSPDLVPRYFFFTSKIKSAVKGYHFESTGYIHRSVTQTLNDIPNNAFQECFKQWQHHWKGCVQA